MHPRYLKRVSQQVHCATIAQWDGFQDAVLFDWDRFWDQTVVPVVFDFSQWMMLILLLLLAVVVVVVLVAASLVLVVVVVDVVLALAFAFVTVVVTLMADVLPVAVAALS